MEFIVEKIGMSRTIDVPSVPVTLLKVVEAKVCEVREDGKALVAQQGDRGSAEEIQHKQRVQQVYDPQSRRRHRTR